MFDCHRFFPIKYFSVSSEAFVMRVGFSNWIGQVTWGKELPSTEEAEERIEADEAIPTHTLEAELQHGLPKSKTTNVDETNTEFPGAVPLKPLQDVSPDVTGIEIIEAGNLDGAEKKDLETAAPSLPNQTSEPVQNVSPNFQENDASDGQVKQGNTCVAGMALLSMLWIGIQVALPAHDPLARQRRQARQACEFVAKISLASLPNLASGLPAAVGSCPLLQAMPCTC